LDSINNLFTLFGDFAMEVLEDFFVIVSLKVGFGFETLNGKSKKLFSCKILILDSICSFVRPV